ncbi:HAD-IA family hydrolase [Methylonatrum kenyense]|uniref:HAD-IA family hydrolase n=1 Tax=Methylonatrum kenyense TaxID=455253 RepID=UPI0020C147D9|nr:HAD-IA family hydrolase [Methylonatrum kenyense]MCK8515112.1 HAD-IA family hydrolase [Methylonatrum kenyense]
MSRIAALSFDLDDTLWELGQVIRRAEQALHDYLQRYHPAVAERYDIEAMAELRRKLADERPGIAHDMTALRIETLRRAAKSCGESEELALPAFHVFLKARNRVRLFPETRPVLERLALRWPLLALTNGNADIQRVGLGSYFRHAISPAEAGAAKPDAAMFALACEQAGVEPAGLMHIGDDPLTDVTGAVRFGLRAIWLNRDDTPWPEGLPQVPHQQVRSLTELQALLMD